MGGYSGGRASEQHEDGAADLDLGVAYAALGHGHPDALDGSEGAGQEVHESGGVFDYKAGSDRGVPVGDGLDVGHGGSCWRCAGVYCLGE